MSLQHLKLGHTRKWPVFLLDKRHWNIGVESSYERCVTSHIPCFPRYSNCQLIGQQLTGSCRNSLKLLIVKLRTPELQLPAPMTYTTILCTRTQTCTTNFPVLLTFPDLHYEHYQIVLRPMLYVLTLWQKPQTSSTCQRISKPQPNYKLKSQKTAD